MKLYCLTIITQNQKSKEKALKIGNHLSAILASNYDIILEKYPKFTDSYKIEIKGDINSSKSIEESIKLTNQICSPWLVSYDELNNEIELIFNKDNSSIYSDNKLNVIKWANFRVEE